MRKDKEKAFELRKEGKSYKQIRAELQIPLATLSDWFRDVDWSGKVRDRLRQAGQETSTVRIRDLNRIRGQNLSKVYEEAREEARQELETLKYNPVFIAGIMLFWGEGTKAVLSQVRFSNSDPEMVRFYLVFLQKACRIPLDKIRIAILGYPDLDEPSVRRFWSFVSGVPLSNFHKTMVVLGRHKTRRLPNGVCTVVISSSYFKVKMLEWLRLLPKELMDRRYYENIS